MPIVATLGLVLGAGYYLWTFQRMFLGQFWVKRKEWIPEMKDLTTREYLMLIPLVVLIIAFGIFPSLLLDLIESGMGSFIEHITASINP